MKKDLNKLSFSELQKEVAELAKKKEKATKRKVDIWSIGENYFIRTVTMSLLGTLKEVTEKEFVLENCSWIADTGRFSDFLKGDYGSNLEVEPFNEDVIVGRGGIIDATIWKNKLLRDRK